MSLQRIEQRVAQFETSAAELARKTNADLPLTTNAAEFSALTCERPGSRLDPPVERALVERAAAANGIDPALVLAVIENESHFDARATSPAGAMGLMQLMPAAAHAFAVNDPYDAVQNVAGGSAYLRTLLARFNGNTALAVAAYNAGPDAVERSGGIPPYPETQRYVGAVLTAYERWRSR